MLSVILLFVLLVCLCVILVLKRWKMDRMTESIPPLPGAAPVIGLAHKALHGDDVLLWERLKQWSLDTNDLGGIAKAWFGPIFFISVTDPELFFTISNACLEKNHMYKFASRWLGRGLVTADVSTWKRHRKLLRPAFSASVVATFLHIFNRQSRQLVSNVEHHVGGGYFDVAPYVAEISLESICQTATGLPDKDAKVVDKNYIRAMNDMLKVVLTRMSTVWMHSDFLFKFSKTKTVEDNAIKVLRKLSDDVIGKRKLARNAEINSKLEPDQRNDSRFKPFFELIFELVDEGSLDEDEARSEVDTVVAAGYDTTQTTLLVTLLVLGSRDDVQEKVVEELIDDLVDEGILDEDEARSEVDTVVAAGYDTTQTTLLVTLLVLGSRGDVLEKVDEELVPSLL
ncbi:cytochrome P450 4c3 [Plutella xylostella]|uniref:cytochrome P450 4c3 n=1 Tax=Plutella xylostella TaxID=51655 RepID=UPI002032C585|nr:cytochrome P450 4c3 [Plutella xylostella]